MAELTTCAQCGVALGDNASKGLCPRCLFQVVLTPELDEVEPYLEECSATGKVRYFGDYEIVSEIARGGMGVVFRARQVSLKRDVALKMILAGLFASRNFVHRFRTEAEAAGKLDHPNIVPIYEIGEHEGQHYFSMKLIDGFSLAQDLNGKPWAMKRAAELVAKVARAVHYAHQRGILHRDIKPANILLDSKGEPHVTDFGLAKIAESDAEVTRTNAFMGSPAYMSPEQAGGQTKNLTTASDVYSLGAVFYELLTGRPPFQGESALDVMQHVVGRDPIAPRLIHAPVDRDLETICLKCLEKDAPRRYGSAEALADDLERWLRCEPILARPVSAWDRTHKWVRRKPALAGLGAALIVVFVLGLAGTLWQWRQAVGNARAEVKQHQLAEANRQLALENQHRAEENSERTDQRSYDSDMKLAQLAWDDEDLGLTRRLLEAHLPGAGGQDRRSFEWFYFWNLCKGEQRMTLTNHSQTVNCVALSPDGKLLATGSVGNPVRIWDTATGNVMKLLPTENVVSLAFAPDGQALGVGGQDQVVVWDLETGREVFKHEDVLGRFSIAFSPVGTLVAIGTHGGSRVLGKDGGSVELWDYITRERKYAFPESGGYVAISSRGDRLATGNWEQAIKIWELTTGRLIRILKTGAVTAMALSTDGQTLATGDRNSQVKLWDVSTGQSIGWLTNYQQHVWSLAFSADNRSLVTGGTDQTIRLWDVATLRESGQLKGHGSEVQSIAFSAAGQMLASGSNDKTARLWSAHPMRAVTTVSNIISRPVFSSDSRLIAAGINQGAVAVWDLASFDVKATIADARDAVAFSADGSGLATQGTNYFLNTFDLTTKTEREKISTGLSATPESHTVLSPNGQILVQGLTNGTLNFSDAKTGIEITNIPHAFSGHIFQMAFSPKGEFLAAAGREWEAGRVPAAKVWDVLAHNRVALLAGHTDTVLGVAFSPDGKTLATCGVDGSIKFWDTTAWKEVPSFLRHKALIYSLAFSPKGRTLASASDDGSLKLWNVATRRELASLRLESTAQYIGFSPDGQTLAAFGWDQTVHVWRAPIPNSNQPRSPDDSTRGRP